LPRPHGSGPVAVTMLRDGYRRVNRNAHADAIIRGFVWKCE
jgi:hypothetical protein